MTKKQLARPKLSHFARLRGGRGEFSSGFSRHSTESGMGQIYRESFGVELKEAKPSERVQCCPQCVALSDRIVPSFTRCPPRSFCSRLHDGAKQPLIDHKEDRAPCSPQWVSSDFPKYRNLTSTFTPMMWLKELICSALPFNVMHLAESCPILGTSCIWQSLVQFWDTTHVKGSGCTCPQSSQGV